MKSAVPVLALSLLLPAAANADTHAGHAPAAGDMVTVWTVDYSGRPPYSRSRETLSVSDVARLEQAEVTEVRTVDYSGRPPFRRNVETLRIIDAARLEVVEDAAPARRVMNRTSFKRHAR